MVPGFIVEGQPLTRPTTGQGDTAAQAAVGAHQTRLVFVSGPEVQIQAPTSSEYGSTFAFGLNDGEMVCI
ncbi:hypothetical protein ColLi_09343 [Colletotrichum liriopes]|uniref:Uncharacterized protein n=1 Tax=Colletotrichum liriopes TaxID=708192 RepID=A0AA37GTK6_9PEZI|nr:hypothetical protein ColLi_09343 [Colletotrichum liriopes]